MSIRVRRVYDPPEDGDGVRVLVDRLWPRGLRKEDAAIDEWPKALTPSTELRRWYHGPHATHEEFVRRYEAELAAPEAAREADRLRTLARSRRLTLLTAVKDPEHSHAAVLAERLT